MDFINKKYFPEKCRITYAVFVCDYCQLKIEQYRAILVVVANHLVYEAYPVSPAASMLKTKLLFDSIIYDAQYVSRFTTCDLKYFFLTIPMLKPEYIKIHIQFFRKI